MVRAISMMDSILRTDTRFDSEGNKMFRVIGTIPKQKEDFVELNFLLQSKGISHPVEACSIQDGGEAIIECKKFGSFSSVENEKLGNFQTEIGNWIIESMIESGGLNLNVNQFETYERAFHQCFMMMFNLLKEADVS